jgi:hypothetical protein
MQFSSSSQPLLYNKTAVFKTEWEGRQTITGITTKEVENKRQ